MTPLAARDMEIVKPSHGSEDEDAPRLKRCSFDSRPLADRSLDEAKKAILLNKMLVSVPDSGLRQFWQLCDRQPAKGQGEANPSPSAELLQQQLSAQVIFSHERADKVDTSALVEPTLQDCRDFVSAMVLPASLASAIEENTRGQADNELWHSLRNGRITSSRFAEVCRRRPTTDPKRLVSQLMGYGPPRLSVAPAMKWGQDNEGRARELYIAQQAAGGSTVSVRHTGLTLSPEMPFLGASSDGVVTVQDGNCSSTGCLEIKCVFSIEGESVVHLTPKEIAEKYGTKFYLHATGKDGQLCLDPEHNYYAQVQGEMAIMGYEWCDFVVFSGGAVHVDRISFDSSFWSEHVLPKLKSFYMEYMAKEILSGKYFCELYGR